MSGCNHDKCIRDKCEFCCYCGEQILSIKDIGKKIRDLESLHIAIKAMKHEALLYDNWYTFVTCEFGEAIDQALKELEKYEN